jgi:tetratricopeptide (TPR) repeat protein
MLAAVAVCGLSLSALISSWLGANRRPLTVDSESLYVSPQAARRMSLSFNGLAADWYWMRALQYVGRKVGAYEGDLSLDDLSPLGLTQLSALLDQSTTLDPQFMAAYEFGAVVLPAVDVDAAVRLVKKGIAENPREWRLYHHLGYIHWRRGEFGEASEAYMAGSRVEGAPAWMRVMAAQMEVGRGSRETARSIYQRMYEESDDEQVRTLAATRLAQVDSLDERERIRAVLAAFRERAGRCPREWGEVANALRAARLRLDASGAPLDPADTPYALEQSSCEVNLNPRSPIPKK